MSRLALVTGASSGIGRAYAQRLASDGWDLMVVARRQDRLEELAMELRATNGVAVEVHVADLSMPGDLARLTTLVSDRSVELLVNNAALAHYMPFASLPEVQAEELIHLDVVTASLRDLAQGVMICVPGLDDTTALGRLDDAQRALLGASGAASLAHRYVDG